MIIVIIILVIVGIIVWRYFKKREPQQEVSNENNISDTKQTGNQDIIYKDISPMMKKIGIITLIISVIIIFVFMGFHFVPYNTGFAIIPKKSLGFSYTFVDLEAFIDEVNNTPVFHRDDTMNYLVNELRKRGIVWNE